MSEYDDICNNVADSIGSELQELAMENKMLIAKLENMKEITKKILKENRELQEKIVNINNIVNDL